MTDVPLQAMRALIGVNLCFELLSDFLRVALGGLLGLVLNLASYETLAAGISPDRRQLHLLVQDRLIEQISLLFFLSHFPIEDHLSGVLTNLRDRAFFVIELHFHIGFSVLNL